MAGKKKKDKKATPETDSDAPKGGKGGLLGAILTPVLLGAVSFGMVYSLPNSQSNQAVESHNNGEHAEVEEVVTFEKKRTKIVELNEFVLSIRNGNQVLRILIALETPYKSSIEIDPNDARLRDAFMSYLRAIEVEKLEDVSFMPNLRNQLLRRAKLALGEENVSGVLITDFLIR